MTDLLNRTKWGFLLWDCLSWLLATTVVFAGYYRGLVYGIPFSPILAYAVIACVLQAVVGTYSKMYLGRWRTGTFDEVTGLGFNWAVVACLTGLAYLGLSMTGRYEPGAPFPYALAVVAPLSAPVFMLLPRLMLRSRRRRESQARSQGKRALIYGAGDSGAQVARLLRTHTDSPYRAIGFIDDDPRKASLVLEGQRVLGNGTTLSDVIRDKEVEAVILAVTLATPTLVSSIETTTRKAGIEMKIVPAIRDIFGGRLSLTDVRDIDVNDLLGRRQIETDIGQVSSYVKNKRVLVTGGGGSIGSELVRQLHNFGPERLIIVDRDEGGLHATQLKVYGKALLDTPDVVLVDIGDPQALDAIFGEHRPEVVFHAAALKHLPLLEQYPEEGWKTNVVGTRNVLEAADRHGVETFVNISTDKAADPSSILGKTKRCAEYLTAWYGQNRPGRYISVRFGNVLGSRGSMLHTFTQQIEKGGPITVTDPEVTRFFMTIPEACELVIQAGAIGNDGDVMVLDMGEPVKIHDVAKYLAHRSGKKIEIVFTGLRPGEKMHEVLFDHGDETQPRTHPMISHVMVEPRSPEKVDAMHDELVASAKNTHQHSGATPAPHRPAQTAAGLQTTETLSPKVAS